MLGGEPAPWNGSYYVGYLPKCGKKKHEVDPPCIDEAKDGKKANKGLAYVVILAPPGDPKVYPE
jgi:hypothetical protein